MENRSGESKVWAFLAYLLSIIGFVLVLLLKKSDRFAMYHAKQSLVLFIASILVGAVGAALLIIPFIGVLASAVLRIIIVVLWIIGIINALTGKEKPLPLIGGFADKIKL